MKKPTVWYQCVVKGCGRRLAGIFTVDGQPVYAERAGGTWNQIAPLRELDRPVVVQCPEDGGWKISTGSMLEQWAASRSRPTRVPLDNNSPERLPNARPSRVDLDNPTLW